MFAFCALDVGVRKGLLILITPQSKKSKNSITWPCNSRRTLMVKTEAKSTENFAQLNQ